jgi:hypothetical protein
MKLAEIRKVKPARVQHVVIPEEAFPLVADGAAVAFVAKSGALRISRNGVTVRPLDEDDLVLRTYLASHAENRSKVISELVRAFVRKLSTLNRAQQLPLPMSA